MTAVDVEVQVSPAPSIDVDVQFGDEPQIDVAVRVDPPTFTVMSVLPTGPRGPAGTDGVGGTDGVDGVDGEGVPTGGTLGQVLTKQSGTDFDTDWDDPTGGGGVTDATYLTTTAHAGLSAEVVVGATPGGELGGTWAVPTVDATHSGSSHASTQAAAEATAAAALASHEADTTAVHGIANTALLETTAGAQAKVDAHVNDTSDAHDASAISILDTANDFTATDVEAALAELQTADEADEAALAAHLSDAADAHDASAVSFVPAGSISATDVQAAIEEVAAEAGTGSGLPDPWTSNQTSGEVTAATDALDITALEFPVPEGQEVAPFIITSDTDLGSTDLIRVRQSVAKGDSDLFTVDDSGEVDVTLVDPAATALKVTEAQDGEATLVEISGSMTDREGISEIMAIGATGLAGGDSTVTRFDGGLRFSLGSFGEVLAFDPVEGTTTLSAHTGQTEPLLVAKTDPAMTEPAFLVTDDTDEERVEIFGDGSLNQYLSDPAVIGWLIKMAAGQTASPLQIQDESGIAIFDFDPVNGNIIIHAQNGPIVAHTQWYAQSFANFSESDLLMSVGGTTAIELDTYWDNNDQTNSYTHVDLKTLPFQAVGNPIVRVWNTDLGKYVLRVLPSGAIGTSAGEPADADINTGEVFRYRDDTPGNPPVRFKGKDSADAIFDAPAILGNQQIAFIDPVTITPEQIANVLIDLGIMAAS